MRYGKDNDPYDMLEYTPEQIIDKIEALAAGIRSDWSDPRGECDDISRLCAKIRELLEEGWYDK